jgi:tripartite-type tricarboxylate transporter receptor subunit TctC
MVAARLIADRLEPTLKKSVVVENRAGATGNIGTLAVVNAKPDGCTLLVNAAVIATFPSSFSKLAYDPIKDLTAVGGIGITPTLLVAAKSVSADDLKSSCN